jgi:hypothetical protein
MGKPSVVAEVQVLRFFETGPIEKAEVLFNIISEKMRERLRGANHEHERLPQSGSPRRRNASGNPKPPGVESGDQNPQA